MANFDGFYQIIFGSVSLLLTLYYQKDLDQDRNQFLSPGNKQSYFGLPVNEVYDFIIVGGGTAGSVVANRLSAKYKVLVLEQGGNPAPSAYVPANYPHLTNWKTSDYIHVWKLVKQKNAAINVENGQPTMFQGKVLGGSTGVNGMIYNRGHANDYNNWAKITKDESWNYENVLKYFQMNEDFQNYKEDDPNNHMGHGPSGLCITQKNHGILSQVQMGWLDSWFSAGRELGYESHVNPNQQKEGFSHFHQITRNGRRNGAYDAFLKPAMSRDTLQIHRYARVNQVHFDANNKAIGVSYTRHGVNGYASARNEIILSAGTLNTPRILMLSGIGPKKNLKENGIDVRVDLPVGNTFQDHTLFFLNEIYVDQQPYGNLSEVDVNQFIENGTGQLADLNGQFAQALIVTDEAKNDEFQNWPDVDFYIGHNSSLTAQGDDSIFIQISLGRVFSFGSVRLNSSDPKVEPLIIDPAYLTHERDVKALVFAAKLAYKVIHTESFKKGFPGLKYRKKHLPNCAKFEFDTDIYWECYIRHNNSPHYHPTSTCPMSFSEDSNGVVDPQLRVKGVKGLRVIDNSIQPTETNSNTMAPALMIGQKGAEMILNDWNI